jgi:hypothetical protein
VPNPPHDDDAVRAHLAALHLAIPMGATVYMSVSALRRLVRPAHSSGRTAVPAERTGWVGLCMVNERYAVWAIVYPS